MEFFVFYTDGRPRALFLTKCINLTLISATNSSVEVQRVYAEVYSKIKVAVVLKRFSKFV